MHLGNALRMILAAVRIGAIAGALVLLLAGCRAAATTAGMATTASTATIANSSVKPTKAPDSASTTSTATTGNTTPSATGAPNSYLFPQLSDAFKSTFPDPFPLREDLLLRTEKAAYPLGTEKITFTIENHTSQQMMSGEPYALEVRTGNAWFSVPYKKLPANVYRAWLAYASIIPANGSWSEVIHLTNYDGLKAGRYRLVKEVYNGIYIATEFNLA